jgi:hypothetical protein
MRRVLAARLTDESRANEPEEATMNSNENTNSSLTETPSTPSARATEEPKTIVGALLDLGASWAAHGLHAGKFTLENSARMLDKTAKAVEGFARDFEKNRKTTG